MDFLEAEGLERGYSNYWVSYRIAFLSGERLIFVPRLPYKADPYPVRQRQEVARTRDQ